MSLYFLRAAGQLTTIVNGAGVVSWLFPKRLVDLEFPDEPLLWYTALGIVAAVPIVLLIWWRATHTPPPLPGSPQAPC